MDFLQQYQKLIKNNPKIFIYSLKSENVDYTNYLFRSKNVFFGFDGAYLTDCGYVFDSRSCTDCFDLTSCLACELCYECLDCVDCYHCGYCQDCRDSRDLLFSYNCRNCSDLFGCVGLSYKQYCIFNKQLAKKEYQKQRIELFKNPPEIHLAKVEILKKQLPRSLNRNIKSENCDFANWSSYSVNLYWSFDLRKCSDCLYSIDLEFSRDCIDCFSLHECELCYECVYLGHSFNCSFIHGGDYLRNCHFCSQCYQSEHLFGCVNLSHAKDCILNKQYSEKDYFAKVGEIRRELGWPESLGSQAKPTERGWWRKGV